SITSGYVFIAVCGPVARTGAPAPPPGSRIQHGFRCSPRLALRLAGLRVHRRLWAGSPDRCASTASGISCAMIQKGQK
ncbi:TPA: hypothetical protein ACTEQ6_000001, partial [Klebsiella oxytoca]